jgi:hypothetical protein
MKNPAEQPNCPEREIINLSNHLYFYEKEISIILEADKWINDPTLLLDMSHTLFKTIESSYDMFESRI